MAQSKKLILSIGQRRQYNINFGGKFLASISAPELSSWVETFIDGTPTGRPTVFPSDLVILIIGNSARL